MIQDPLHSERSLQIRTPCAKTWAELSGGEGKRYCSQCCLFVHDAARLSQSEAQAMITSATSRVCMRIEYDQSGAPVFRDSANAATTPSPARKRPALRFARWAITAAASLVAACHDALTCPAPNDPSVTASGGENANKLGEVYVRETVGDVALPRDRPVMLGEAVVQESPEPVIPPESPSLKDGE